MFGTPFLETMFEPIEKNSITPKNLRFSYHCSKAEHRLQHSNKRMIVDFISANSGYFLFFSTS